MLTGEDMKSGGLVDDLLHLFAHLLSVGRRAFLSGLGKGLAVIAGAASGAVSCGTLAAQRTPSAGSAAANSAVRRRTLLDQEWRFTKGDLPGSTVSLLYDRRPQPTGGRGAQTAPPPVPESSQPVIKAWILPSGNNFVNDPSKHAKRPQGNPGEGLPYIAATFDDSSWQKVDVPHDYAIAGPFSTAGGGGMGRLPCEGVVWYRRNLNVPASSAGKSLFLDIDGAMSYSEVWLNGQFVGGWPYGYASFRLNLTPYAEPGEDNALVIRLDNPPASSRWYPGGGLYRNVWLVETSRVHVAQWGSYITTPEVSASSASIDLKVRVDNDSNKDTGVTLETLIYELDAADRRTGQPVARIAPAELRVAAGA